MARCTATAHENAPIVIPAFWVRLSSPGQFASASASMTNSS